MFNNCNPKTNGEHKFFMDIKDKVNVIFDVGCRSDSEFIHFEVEVHYFDPIKTFIDKLKQYKTKNTSSYYNVFGLGNENNQFYYYPKLISE